MKKLLCWISFGASLVCAQRIDGLWDAVLTVDSYEVPFRIEFSQKGTELRGSFLDGDLKVTSTSGEREGDNLHLRFDYYNSDLRAVLKQERLEGEYVRKGQKGLQTYSFRASRFTPAPAVADSGPSITGEWILRTDVSGRPPIWRFLVRQSGREVTGAILRLDGDTGTLSGTFRDGKLTMSHFSGARAARLEATLQPDGTLQGNLNRRVNFTGARASEASTKGIPEPPDPSRFTSVRDPSEPFHFSFPDPDGRVVSDADDRFRGKVVIVNIMGSWCPNCHDETPFLVDLYRKYHSRGLEIVALSFEYFHDSEQNFRQIGAFARRHGVAYPILLAGVVASGVVQQKMPQIANFDAYPTSFFLGRDGRVKSVHAGFASPATGATHVELKREIEGLVERLLAEKPES
jgi:thiol-disulfide isomerase/thioredoxin